MKLGDFNLLDDEQPADDLAALIAGFNANVSPEFWWSKGWNRRDWSG